MADRILKALPGDRYVGQGISQIGGSRFEAVQANSEVFTYKIDFTRWLDGATISSDTVSGTSATVVTVASTSYLTLTISEVSGAGSVTVTVIASDGRSKELIVGMIEGRATVPPAYITTPESEGSGVGYNNTDSNLSATNIQEAIDELAAAPDTIASELGFTIDGGGLVIVPGTQVDLSVSFACTITASRLLADQATSAVLDIWKVPYSGFPPTVANTITAAALPTLSGVAQTDDTTLTGWTTSIAAGDCIRVNVNSNDKAKRIGLFLSVNR